jgi:hypothetical protein
VNRVKASPTAARATRGGRRDHRDAKSVTDAAEAVAGAAQETTDESAFATRRTSRTATRSADGHRPEHTSFHHPSTRTIVVDFSDIHVHIHVQKNIFISFFLHLEHLGGSHCIARRFLFFHRQHREIPQTRHSGGFERSVLYQGCVRAGAQACRQLGRGRGPAYLCKRAIFAARSVSISLEEPGVVVT